MKTLYDVQPYVDHAFSVTHPAHTAAIGRLYGMRPQDVNRCRVLELACAGGGNLIPLAQIFPGSQFVGVDLSPRQISHARNTITALGLDNIEVHAMDLTTVGERFGRFDYIIAHGIYSWVPEHVQVAILDLFRALLTEHGIGFVNFCVRPGAYAHELSREIMRYGCPDDLIPAERIRRGRARLDALLDLIQEGRNPHLALLRKTRDSLREKDDIVLLHDDLADIYTPLYFHEFTSRAEDAGLQYLGDGEFVRRNLIHYPSTFRAKLAGLCRDFMDLEQLTDFLLRPTSRCALLCRRETKLAREVEAEAFADLYLSSTATRVAAPARNAGGHAYRSKWGNVLYDPDPVFQRAMDYLLAVYPRALEFTALLHALEVEADEVPWLRARLLNARAQHVLDLTVDAPAVDVDPGERPRATPLARWQARQGTRVVSLWHENVVLDDFARRLLPLLDGSCDREGMRAAIRAGEEGTPEPAGAENMLESTLQRLAKSGLLLKVPDTEPG